MVFLTLIMRTVNNYEGVCLLDIMRKVGIILDLSNFEEENKRYHPFFLFQTEAPNLISSPD